MEQNEQVQLEIFNEQDYPADKKASDYPDWPAQGFHVSHLDENSFMTPGFRPWSLSRDLGMIKATAGMVDAHVNRRARPFNGDEISHRHFHNVHFQMVYVLKGWMRIEFEGQGEILMKEGSCWLQPPKIRHTVMCFSDDLELLEMIIPAKYDTVMVNEPPGGHPKA